jgi:hypothetical protein
MDNLWIFIAAALVIQLGYFLYSRHLKGKPRNSNMKDKYSIRSRNDAWKLLNDPSLPDQDREKILEIYTQGFNESQ